MNQLVPIGTGGQREQRVDVRDRMGLLSALRDGARSIHVRGRIVGLPPLTLRPGQSLLAGESGSALVFSGDDIAMTADNRIEGLQLVCPSNCRALRLDHYCGDRGIIALGTVTCSGQIQLIFGDETSAAQVRLDSVGIADADTTARLDRLDAGARRVQQGAVTIWNRSGQGSDIRVAVVDLDIGSPSRPVRGAGIAFGGGHGPTPGTVTVETLGVGAVHVHSGITTPRGKLCGGGIVVLRGVSVDTVDTRGPIVTQGARCRALDNDGVIGSCRIRGNALVKGSAGAGVRNAGSIGRLEIDGAIEAFGQASIGCDLDGSAGLIRAKAIRTRGRGSPAVRIGGRLEALEAIDGIFAEGGAERQIDADAECRPSDGVVITESGWLGRLVALRIRSSGADAMPFRNRGAFG